MSNIENNLINPDDYVTLMQIGKGNFSEVYLVEHKLTKILYSLKMFTKLRVEQLKKQQDVLIEKHVMKKISLHKNLIKFYGSNKDEFSLYILYEYVNGGELWKKCMVYGLPSLKLIKFYFLQILDGIEHLHKFKIVHRDIKPENIMVTKDELCIKIIDFGSCKDMEGTEFEKQFEIERLKQKVVKPSYKNFVGTPNYMAPECVRNKNSDYKSDMWSLGCVLFHLFVGFPPFLGKSDYLIFKKSIEANFNFPEDIVDVDAMDLIKKLIVIDPNGRLTMEEVYEHPFIRNGNSDEEFRNKYPIFTLGELAFLNIQKSLRKKYSEFLDYSLKLEKIKNYEDMEADCRKNGIPEDEGEFANPIMKEGKQLFAEKEILKEKFEIGLNNLKNEIEDIKNKINNILTNDNNEKINYNKNIYYDEDLHKLNEYQISKILNKFNQLQKQILHEIFRIDYEITSEENYV